MTTPRLTKALTDSRLASPRERWAAVPAQAVRPIRVLIVDTAISFGGTLVVARNLLKHLDSNLVDASLVSACSDGFVSGNFAGNAEVRLLSPGIDYASLSNWKVAIHKKLAWKPLRRTLELAVIIFGILASVPYMVRLAFLCHRLRTDIIHVNNFTMEALWTARLIRMPIIYHFHGHVSARLERSARQNFRRVQRFVSVSNGVTESAVRAGIDPRRIRTIPNFVGEPPDTAPPPMPEKPAIGIFGRVTQWKGQKQFLMAALQVLPKFPELRALIVGDPSDGAPTYMEECREIARASGFADRIEFTGRVTDVTRYYKQCSIVVHASTSPEPFGMVLIEAMAQARPLIASAFGAASEIITDGTEGFVVNPNDTAALVAKISELLSNPAKAKSMGLAGLERVRAAYGPRDGARRFEHLYSEVASEFCASH
jgi:glycosyltransferase involved in cell wall biosynthesis